MDIDAGRLMWILPNGGFFKLDRALLMSIESQLREKLREIEALFAVLERSASGSRPKLRWNVSGSV